ncbi:Peptidoglycan D,D-transpeptidase FtsI [Streptomyces microflavus]
MGTKTGLGYPGESPGLLAHPKDWSTSQQYTIPFGQGLSLNAVQAASVYSTIANGGVRIAPTLVRGTKGADGRFTSAEAPEKNRVVSEKTAKTLATMLESVVDDQEGTGTKAAIPGYRVAGKTGTANRVDPVRGVYKGYTASFAGFARPTIRRSPSTARSRTPPREATSAARSAARSTSRSWSSPSRRSRPHHPAARAARCRSCRNPASEHGDARASPKGTLVTTITPDPGNRNKNSRDPVPRFARRRTGPVRSPCPTLISPKPPRRTRL